MGLNCCASDDRFCVYASSHFPDHDHDPGRTCAHVRVCTCADVRCSRNVFDAGSDHSSAASGCFTSGCFTQQQVGFALDSNNDGQVSQAELKLADANQDGVVDASEIKAAASKKKKLSKKKKKGGCC